MRFGVKTLDAKSHLVVCSAINIFTAQIIDDEIKGNDDYYGRFLLDGNPDMLDSISFLPGIIIEIPRI